MAAPSSGHSVPPHDIWDDSGRCKDIRERFGHDLTAGQTQIVMCHF